MNANYKRIVMCYNVLYKIMSYNANRTSSVKCDYKHIVNVL